MGTFAAGHMLEEHTGRPIAAQVVQVLAYPTDLPVTPDDGPVVTGARGGYGMFTVPGLDAVTLVASDGTRVGPIASVEAQVAAGNAGPFLESAEQRLTDLESRSGTSVLHLGPSVATAADLPTGDSPGEARIAEDTGHFWVWDGTDWVDTGKVAQGPKGDPGETPDASTSTEPVQVYSAVGDVPLVMPEVSTVHALTLTGNVTLTLPSVPEGRACYVTVVLRQDATGGRTVTWPASVRWVGGIIASASPGPGVTDVAVMFTVDGGASWLGSLTKGYI